MERRRRDRYAPSSVEEIHSNPIALEKRGAKEQQLAVVVALSPQIRAGLV